MSKLELSDDSSDPSDASNSQSEDDDCAWVPWFCSLQGNEFFCVVDAEFIQDSFNLTGLSAMVAYYDQALDMILDMEQDDSLTDEQQNLIENEAENLYGLIHARFLLTTRGQQLMAEKFRSGQFGRCPRYHCRQAQLIPVGLTDIPKREAVKLYCSSCNEVYIPRSTRHEHIDGSFFGTTFAHLFYMVYPELRAPITVGEQAQQHYVPRVFGFKIHYSSQAKCLESRNKQLQQQQADAAAKK